MTASCTNNTYQVLDIIRGTTVDGPGFRTAVYLAGCSHHCQGCHNPDSWRPTAGKTMTLEEIMAVVREEDFDVTLTGGDPLFNPEALARLIDALKKDHRNVWLYTGYTWEKILANQSLYQTATMADVIVEGPYIEALRDTDLQFRGSSNQRIIKINADVRKE